MRIVRELEAAEQAVRCTQSEPQGVLRVNAPMSFGQLRLGKVRKQVLAHPGVPLEGRDGDRRDGLREGARVLDAQTPRIGPRCCDDVR